MNKRSQHARPDLKIWALLIRSPALWLLNIKAENMEQMEDQGSGRLNRFQRLSLKKKILILGIVSLTAVFGFTIFEIVIKVQAAMQDASTLAAQQIAQSIANGTATFGETGDMKGLEMFLGTLSERKDLDSVHAFRSVETATLLGARKGGEPSDEQEKQVLATGQSQVVSNSASNTIRFVLPIHAKQSCLSCHTSSRDGAVLGGVSVAIKTDRTVEEVASIRNSTILIGVISILIELVLLVWLITQNVIKPVQTVMDALKRRATHLGEISKDVASTGQAMAQGTTEQAAAVQETAASLEEIAAMISRNSDNADSAKKSSAESLESVKSGQQALIEMLKAMDEISQNNDSFNLFMTKNNAELNEMVQVITSIADKTKVINDIVFQTKLLSFNASVEAARAGEQGKGFAVVAEEIGNLAQMSGSAANEIKVQLDESIVKVNKIVSTTKSQVDLLINSGKEKIKLGIAKAKQCDVVLNEINNTSSSTESLVSEVAHASREQSQGIDEVNKAMGQIDEVTNQSAAEAEASIKTVSELTKNAQEVTHMVAKLESIINGSET